jgi:carbon monoxide dehydrogenase subunit G
MAHVERDIEINRSPADVLAFVADGLNNPKWRELVLSVALKSGEAASEGAEYTQVMKGPAGSKIKGDYRITKLVPEQELVFEVFTGMVQPKGRFVVKPSGEGTNLSFALDYQPRGIKRLMDGMITKTMQKEADVEALKAAIEAAG